MKLTRETLLHASLLKKLLCCPIALVAAAALSAQNTDLSGHHVGMYISLAPSAPTPDAAISAYDGTIYTSDIVSDIGYIFGFFWEMPLAQKRMSGRLGFEYGVFGGKTIDYMLYSKRYATHHIGLMYDVQLYFDKQGRFYIFGGLGYTKVSIDEYLWGTRMRSYDVSSDVCRSLGGGGVHIEARRA
jgi:hypothetical protein